MRIERLVSSFDLYDTLIMRQSLSSESLYESVWCRLRDSGHAVPDCLTFVQQRLQADSRSRHLDAPDLRQILEFLDPELTELRSHIESCEIAVELDQITLIPGARDRVVSARNSGQQIAFISDMHIGAKHLGPKLETLGLLADEDWFLVSSDHGMSKSRGGRLFRHFLDIHNLEAGCVTHYGNSDWSDVKMARRHKIRAKLCASANLTRYESSLLQDGNLRRQLEPIAAAVRAVRVTAEKSGAKPLSESSLESTALVEVASSVAGPALIAFTLWSIKRCRAQGISTVRFLTRDGELPLLIARALPEHITEGLDLGMLEVSRKSLLLPAASATPFDRWLECGQEPGSYLVQHYDRLPARKLIERVGMSFEQHADLLSVYGISNPNLPLGTTGLQNWMRALQSSEVRSVIKGKSLKVFEVADAYLRQELPDAERQRVALVDIGWTGQQAAMLSALIRQRGGLEPLHLHVGRIRDKPLIDKADVDCWLFDERQTRSLINNAVALFESFCVSLSGGVDGYVLDQSGSVNAVRLAQLHQSSVETWGQPRLRECVVDLAHRVGEHMNGVETEMLRSTVESLLLTFWDTPSYHEALKWGQFPYEQDQTGQSIKQLASPYTLASVWLKLKGSHSDIDWKAGSIELTSSPLKQCLKLREKFRKRAA